MTAVNMPRLSDSMEEGAIIEWLVADGEHVEHGQELIEVETDKATVVYSSESDGILHHVAEVGDTVAVGQLIAQILAAGETLPSSSRGDDFGPDAEGDTAVDAPRGPAAKNGNTLAPPLQFGTGHHCAYQGLATCSPGRG